MIFSNHIMPDKAPLPHPNIGRIIIGGGIGAAVDIGIQLWNNGGQWECVNWWQVGQAALIGAGLQAAIELWAARAGIAAAWSRWIQAGGGAEKVAIGEGGGAARFTFRGDSRGPDVIFNEGFAPRGSSTDLLAHAFDNTLPPSAYVSTSKSAEVAAGFADNVYVVRSTNGIDVNRVLGPASPFPNELEIAIPGRVQPGNVRAVTLPNRGVSILNPNYKP